MTRDDVALVGVVVLVVGMHRAGAADDLLVAAVAACHVDPDRDRLFSLVGDDDALSHAAGSLDGCVHGRERGSAAVRRSAALGCFRAFAAAAARRRRRPSGGARRPVRRGAPRGCGRLGGRARCARARLAPALLRRQLLLGLGGGVAAPPRRPPPRRGLLLGLGCVARRAAALVRLLLVCGPAPRRRAPAGPAVRIVLVLVSASAISRSIRSYKSGVILSVVPAVGGADLALTFAPSAPGEVALGAAEARRVVQFAGCVGEAQAEQLFATAPPRAWRARCPRGLSARLPSSPSP